jgi:putative acetyltransferase
MEITNYNKKYAKEIVDLIHSAVHSVSKNYYSPEQLEAWSQTPPNYVSWAKKLEDSPPILLIKNEVVVAFTGLKKRGEIDFLYTHPNYQRQGFASYLYSYIENLAYGRNEKNLSVYASKVAKSFFLKQGFDLVRENIVTRNDVDLVNYFMTKELNKN